MATKTKPEKKEKDKIPCPVTREQFLKEGKPIEVIINGVPMAAGLKVFASGGFGYFISGKTPIKVGDVPVPFQVTLNISVINAAERVAKGTNGE